MKIQIHKKRKRYILKQKSIWTVCYLRLHMSFSLQVIILFRTEKRCSKNFLACYQISLSTEKIRHKFLDKREVIPLFPENSGCFLFA